MRRKLIVANWKMNGSLELCRKMMPEVIREAQPQPQMVICPPALLIGEIARQAAGTALAWGVQNVSHQTAGAFTGEVSVPMAHELGCSYAIVGHSERRALFSESDELVADKAQACLSHQIMPIVCIGETLEQRQQHLTFNVLATQLKPLIERVDAKTWSSIVIAYEPVWAIGTGQSAKAEHIAQVMRFIRHFIDSNHLSAGQTVSLLYGGSVKPEGAEHIFQVPDVDGALVGGASLNVDDWLLIYRAAVRSYERADFRTQVA